MLSVAERKKELRYHDNLDSFLQVQVRSRIEHRWVMSQWAGGIVIHESVKLLTSIEGFVHDSHIVSF